jgi:alpha-beta hydrolase superfamily lysophospholipase
MLSAQACGVRLRPSPPLTLRRVSASLALGIAGTIIAVLGLIFTALERRDRRRADADERRDRIEQNELVRRQVATSERQTELEESAHEAARAADVHVKRGGRDSLGSGFDLVKVDPPLRHP